MTILYINTGSTANAGDGDSLRTAFTKINQNFEFINSLPGDALVVGTGYTGSTGGYGYTGSGGFDGSRGFVGSRGAGYTGSASTIPGPAGYAGSRGLTGYVGSQGNLGPTGYVGSASTAAGYAGSQGDIGPIGYVGSQSTEIGYTGSQGEQGVGFVGSQGVAGYAGSRGDLGYTGSIGPEGPQGFSPDVVPGGIYIELNPNPVYTNVGAVYVSTLTQTFVDGQAVRLRANIFRDNTTPIAIGVIREDGGAGALLVFDENNILTMYQMGAGFQNAISQQYDLSNNIFGIRRYLTMEWQITPDSVNGSVLFGGVLGVGAVEMEQIDPFFLNLSDITSGPYYLCAFSAGGRQDIADVAYELGIGIGGANGYTGSQGSGYTGSASTAIGYTGSSGTDGYTGSIGYTGSTGFVGSASTEMGPQGLQGYDGSTGYTGSRGAGFTGSAGVIGYSGSRGFIGSTGFVGSKGDAGFIGSFGYTGSVGDQGIQGDPGVDGAQGYTGSIGIGFTGSAGVGYTGSRSTLPGPTGFTGSVGAGYTGSKGESGSTIVGFTGSAGTNGYTGSLGYTGSQGYTGSAGTNGFTGSAGTNGAIGFTGSVGPDIYTPVNVANWRGTPTVSTMTMGLDELASRMITQEGKIGGASISATSPTDPQDGQIWWNSDTGVAYIFVDDGNSTQWVSLSIPGPAGTPGTVIDLTAVASDIIPSTDLTYDLGSSSRQWRSLHVGTSTIYLGGIPLTVNTGGNLTVNGSIVGTANRLTNNGHTVQLQSSGVLQLPVEGAGQAIVRLSSTTADQDDNGIAKSFKIDVNGATWYFDKDGKLNTPGTWVIGDSATHTTIGNNGFANTQDLSLTAGDSVFITTNASSGNNSAQFMFSDRVLQLPAGGDIHDSNGDSVLGGGGTTTIVSDTAPASQSTGTLWWDTVDGNLYVNYANAWVLSNSASGSGTGNITFSTASNYNIISSSESSGIQIKPSGGLTGIFIPGPANDSGVTPVAINNYNAQGTVTINTNNGFNGTGTKTWTFGNDGVLTIPNTIQTPPGQYFFANSDTSIEVSTTWPTHANSGDPVRSGITTSPNGDFVIDVLLQDGNPNAWTFSGDGRLLLGGVAGVIYADQNTGRVSIGDYIGAGGAPAAPSNVLHIGGPDNVLMVAGYAVSNPPVWTFGNDGKLTLPGALQFSSAGGLYMANQNINNIGTLYFQNGGVQANAYLGNATTSTVGGVKVDGTTISVNGAGLISAISAATAGTVTTAAQPAITSVGTLTNLTVSGTVTATNFVGNGSGLTGVPTKVSGSWTLATGTNTVSFTVATQGTYIMWVDGNVPNGIVVWNARASLSNSNVPVIGEQYGWYYAMGNQLVLTSMPAQIIGTQGAISTATVVGSTTNVFTFGITNNSTTTQVVTYGYTKV